MTIKEIDKRLKKIDTEHAEMLESISDAEQSEATAYRELIEAMAGNDVGDSSAKSVKDAEKAFKKAREGHSDTRLKLEAKEKALEMLQEKRQQAIKSRKTELKAEIQRELPNVLQPIFDALDKLDKGNEELEAFRNKYANSVMGAPEADKHIPKRLKLYTAKNKVAGADLGRIVDPIENWKKEFQSLTK